MRRRALVAIAFALVAAVACSGENYRREAKPVDGPEDVAVPNDPAETAAALARVEGALRAPTTRPTEVARLSRDQQNAYRALGAHPQWLDDVVARLPADVQSIVTANAQAGRDLQELGGEGPPPRALPDWQIVSPLPAETLRAYYGEAEAASGISWAYLASIHLVETRLGRIRGTSSAGAQGPMQFIPATWARDGLGDMNRALFRYNNSNLYVAAVDSYAQLMLSDERAFLGYYGWQVYYATTDGTFVLPEGYPDEEAQRVTRSGD